MVEEKKVQKENKCLSTDAVFLLAPEIFKFDYAFYCHFVFVNMAWSAIL